MMNIAHLTSVHTRYDSRVFLKECYSLAAYGFNVTLIVADGKGDEIKEAVHILDVGASKGRLDRIINAPKRVLIRALELDADIYHLHDPELLPIGINLKKKGKKVVYDMHENLDLQIIQKKWIPWILRKPVSIFFHKYEKEVLKKIDRLVVPQIFMKERFDKFVKTEIIANFPDNYVEVNETKKFHNKYKILYAGGISEPRGLLNMLNLIIELKNINKDYSLTLAGYIDKIFLDEIKNHRAWAYVNYKGLLSIEALNEEYKKHSIGLILFNNVGQYFMAYSLKLFEYMQHGMLVIMPNFGDWPNFNQLHNVGYCVDTQNSVEIAKIIDAIDGECLSQVGIRNRLTINQKFLWNTQFEKLIDMYRELKDS